MAIWYIEPANTILSTINIQTQKENNNKREETTTKRQNENTKCLWEIARELSWKIFLKIIEDVLFLYGLFVYI